MEVSRSVIVIDALTIRRGGGLVLLENLALELVRRNDQTLYLLCQPDVQFDRLFNSESLVIHRIAGIESAASAFYYRLAKLDRYINSIASNCTLITFNSWSKTKHKQITFHINTIPFLPYWERHASVGHLRSFLLRILSKMAMKKSVLNIFESQYLYELAKSSIGVDIKGARIRYFGSDLERAPYSELPSYTDRANQIITITSGANHKQNHKVFELYRYLKTGNPTLRLVVVGNADLIRNDVSNSASSNLADQDGVDFLGYLSRDRLRRELTKSKALISLSTTESFYLVAVEAMFCGTPVIVKRIASAEESCGKHAMYLDNDAPSKIVENIQQIFNEKYWSELSESGYWYSEKFESQRCLAAISDDIYDTSD